MSCSPIRSCHAVPRLRLHTLDICSDAKYLLQEKIQDWTVMKVLFLAEREMQRKRNPGARCNKSYPMVSLVEKGPQGRVF